MVVLLHATFNLPLTLVIAPLGRQATVPFLLYVGLWVAAPIAVVIWAGPKHLSRRHRKQEEREKGAAEPGVATLEAVTPTPV